MFMYITKLLSYSLVLFASELSYRLSVLLPTEVYQHNVAFKSAAQDVLALNVTTKAFVIGAVLVGAVFGQHTLWATVGSSDGLIMFLAYFICRSVSLHQSTSLEQLQFVRQRNGLDYGSGMAVSYFFGYLKIVLSSTGERDSKSIRERMEDYEDSQQVSIPLKKLVILVPYSMYTPQKLTSDNLEEARNLETIIMNRGGIKDRKYHNSVYKIKGTGWYVAAEGASPLQTFYEAMATSEVLRKNRHEIRRSFVAKLRELLWDDLSCRNLCVVVPIKDQDEKGKLVDYGIFLKNIIERELNTS